VVKEKKLRSEDGFPVTEEEISPLSLFAIVVSVSALCNAQARWLFANVDQLREQGGYAAAADLQLVADILLAMVEDNYEAWREQKINMPPGYAHVPWSVKTATDEEKGDLPF